MKIRQNWIEGGMKVRNFFDNSLSSQSANEIISYEISER